MESIHFRAMGTSVEVLVNSESMSPELTQTLSQTEHRIRTLERRLSRFQEQSDVNRINGHPGEWIAVHRDTVHVVQMAKRAHASSKGLFNPCLGHVLENHGYNVSFEDVGKNEPQVNHTFIEYPMTECPIDVDEENIRVRIQPGTRLDLGGIAKGWIVQQAANLLLSQGISNFVCNAGGDMICRGVSEIGPWHIGIENPFRPGDCLTTLNVTDLSIATSGTYKRTWIQAGHKVNHLIDPRYGGSTKSDIVSCTIFHSDLSQAEILAKCALLLFMDPVGCDFILPGKTRCEGMEDHTSGFDADVFGCDSPRTPGRDRQFSRVGTSGLRGSFHPLHPSIHSKVYRSSTTNVTGWGEATYALGKADFIRRDV